VNDSDERAPTGQRGADSIKNQRRADRLVDRSSHHLAHLSGTSAWASWT